MGRIRIERGPRLRVINLGPDAAHLKVSESVDVHDEKRVLRDAACSVRGRIHGVLCRGKCWLTPSVSALGRQFRTAKICHSAVHAKGIGKFQMLGYIMSY